MSFLAAQPPISCAVMGAEKQILCITVESCFGQKWHHVDHMGVVYSTKSSVNHHYISKEGYETLKQQWMSLLVAHPHISCPMQPLESDFGLAAPACDLASQLGPGLGILAWLRRYCHAAQCLMPGGARLVPVCTMSALVLWPCHKHIELASLRPMFIALVWQRWRVAALSDEALVFW